MSALKSLLAWIPALAVWWFFAHMFFKAVDSGNNLAAAVMLGCLWAWWSSRP